VLISRVFGGGDVQAASLTGRRQITLRHARLTPLWRRVRLLLMLSPSLLAAAYYGAIASDQYVSEARFVIRTASKPSGVAGGLGALLQMVGIARSQDDAWAVHDFLTSRDAVRALSSRLDLRTIYGRNDADFLARYPSILYGGSEERLFDYFQRMLTVVVVPTTGLTTLRVDAFRAADAQKVAAALLDLGEDLVNRLNDRTQADAVRVAAAEVARFEQRRIVNQQAITTFRNRELLLDPEQNSAIVLEVIGKLSTALADARANLDELRASSPSSPNLPSMKRQVGAIEGQIALERSRVGSASDALANKIAEYEKLNLEREFSIRALSQSVASLEQARLEAWRQQLFLERVVEPGAADYATMPQRWRMGFTVFGFNVLGLAVGWLIVTGLREHAGVWDG
jgi:capsular polysaccharide transport system permease protein